MIVVTGGAGFIGSNLVRALVKKGADITIVDTLGCDQKWKNLVGVNIWRWYQPSQLDQALAQSPEIVLHMGAISSTTAQDGTQVLENNFSSSVQIWDWCVEHYRPMIYASSASTYGDGNFGFDDSHHLVRSLRPLNLYAWSKQLFDLRVLDQVRENISPPQWAGLKFFNVYGPGEQHKGNQSSVIFQQWQRVQRGEPVRLFASTSPDYKDGGQLRDFVWVGDCVRVIEWFIENPQASGLFNVGSGTARSFNDLALALYKTARQEPRIEYVPMPEPLKAHYQNYTCANIAKLRNCGYNVPMTTLEQGIGEYVEWLSQQHT